MSSVQLTTNSEDVLLATCPKNDDVFSPEVQSLLVSLGKTLLAIQAEGEILDKKETAFQELMARRRNSLAQRREKAMSQLVDLALDTALRSMSPKSSEFEAAFRDL